MKIEVLPDVDAVARRAAGDIACQARAAISERGRFLLAVSGGRTPWQMLRCLSAEDLPWHAVHIVQVDERVAPADSPDRNLMHLHDCLSGVASLPRNQVHAMPVDLADLEAAARSYAESLRAIAGSPPKLDLVHLGLGSDGHTASLIPGDPVLQVQDADVAATGIYQGRRRLTLTYPVLNRARRILWLVTGSDKARALGQLRAGDPAIPAGRVRQDQAALLADQAAAAGLTSE